MNIHYLDSDIGRTRRAAVNIKEKIFSIRDLVDPALCHVPEKYLKVSVSVSRIFGCDIAARLKHDKAAITAN